ncbi:MAG: exonuclease SbcCD subunit D [Gemmatimonadetes bacterium]|nr:exonuclease SbcCD subunit D [Gemmatimonadota bacterium]
MRFVHIADVHLDTAFAGRSDEIRRRLRQASRDALQRAVETARVEAVDALLIAGDLFDGDRLSFETERFVLEQLSTLSEAGIRIVYATGNHDPGRRRLRGGKLEWPSTMTLIPDGRPRSVPVVGEGGYPVGIVTGAGHASSRETADLARELKPTDADLPQVALLHTQVLSARGLEVHQPYAPSDIEHLRTSGFDYWALGHVHLRQEVSAEPPIHYPGNLQGRNPRETGPKGGLLVDLRDPGNPAVEFREFATVRWEKLLVDGLGEAETLEHLVRAVTQAWDDTRRTDPGETDTEWMVAVDLVGPSPLWRELRQPEEIVQVANELALQLGAMEVEVRVSRIHPRAQVQDHADRQDVLGAAIRLARSVARGHEGLNLAPEDLAGFKADRGISLEDYVRELLEGAPEEILAQMWVPSEEAG